MPTYDYQCNKCGETFEVSQSIKAVPLRQAHCEACGKSQPVKRLIGTGGAVLFKGAGFYETDYRSAGYRKAAKDESEKKGGAATSDKTKKDSAKSSSSRNEDTSSKDKASTGTGDASTSGPSKRD
jgi:putative FmdB family regulatory protein